MARLLISEIGEFHHVGTPAEALDPMDVKLPSMFLHTTLVQSFEPTKRCFHFEFVLKNWRVRSRRVSNFVVKYILVNFNLDFVV